MSLGREYGTKNDRGFVLREGSNTLTVSKHWQSSLKVTGAILTKDVVHDRKKWIKKVYCRSKRSSLKGVLLVLQENY